MQYQNLTIEKIFHAAVKIKGKQVIYLDPFQLPANCEPADLILITHEHHDHCSLEDLKKISRPQTVIIASAGCRTALDGLPAEQIIYVKPGDVLNVKNIKVEAVPAYNINKFRSPGVTFHPKEDGKVGYVLNIEGVKIYHAGDTDEIPEMKNLKNLDIALMPVSGIFVMTPEEAAETANLIQPKIAVPIHYGDYEFNGQILGPKVNAEIFKKLCKVPVEII